MSSSPDERSAETAAPEGAAARAERSIALVAAGAVGVAAVLSLTLLPFVDLLPVPEPIVAAAASPPTYVEPPPPPPALDEVVDAGRHALLDDDLGSNGLACTSCHFEAGRTDGGRNGGISLVGAAVGYPAVSGPRVVTLADRINLCLVRNLGGPPLATDSPRLAAIETYLRWLSAGIPAYHRPSWLGVSPVLEAMPASSGDGELVFRTTCAPCHGSDGGGTDIAPPLWGPRSFSDASGLAREPVLAGFVRANMPRQNPLLDGQEAADVAAYLLSRPRPG